MTKNEKELTDGEIKQLIDSGKAIVILFGAVYDLTSFLKKHPGGSQIILDHVGQDSTEFFVEVGHLTKGRVL